MARQSWTTDDLVAGIRSGDARALARAITLIESSDPQAAVLVREIFPETGRAHSVGITGPPGVGKSTLISALVRHTRSLGLTVGVVSVDPSSPFTSGALLGDRIRLTDHFLDPGVFIRSMGTRGHPGGLAEAALQAMLVLDASGKDIVFLETVGTGQNEVGVASIADTVVLTLMPGSGDSVQALKAGIMEIPDIVCVNRLSHPLAGATVNDVRQALMLGSEREANIPVALTEAATGEGVATLWEVIARHLADLREAGTLDERRRHNLAGEVFAVALARARRHLENAVAGDEDLRRLLDRVARRELDPLTAVQQILLEVFHVDQTDRTNTR